MQGVASQAVKTAHTASAGSGHGTHRCSRSIAQVLTHDHAATLGGKTKYSVNFGLCLLLVVPFSPV